MKIQHTSLMLLVSFILSHQIIFGAKIPVKDIKEARVDAPLAQTISTQSMATSMQKLALADNDEIQLETTKLVAESINTELDDAYKRAQGLIKQLNELKIRLQDAHNNARVKKLDAHQMQRTILPINIKYDKLEDQYNQCMYAILSLLLFAEGQGIVTHLSEDNAKLYQDQISTEKINKRLQSAAVANKWSIIQQILHSTYAQPLTKASTINTLFLFAVFNRMINIINDILQSPILTSRLNKTTLGYAHACASIRSDSALLDAISANPTTAHRYRDYTQDMKVARQSNIPKDVIERDNLEDLSSITDVADLEVFAAHKGFFRF